MDPFSAAALGGAGLLSGIGTSIFNYKSQQDTNALNERLTREGWLRDDTAVQRRSADMKAAGINPVMAAGSPAVSGGAIHVADAPQISNPIGPMLQGVEMAKGIVDIDRTRAQTDLVNAQEQYLRTSKTPQTDTQAFLQGQNALIAQHDLGQIVKGNDPRYRNTFGQIGNMMKSAFAGMQLNVDRQAPNGADLNSLSKQLMLKHGLDKQTADNVVQMTLGSPAWVEVSKRLLRNQGGH